MISEEVKANPVVETLTGWDESTLVEAGLIHGQLVCDVEPGRILDICRLLREKGQFNRLASVTAVDRYPSEPRFEIVYQLHSIPTGQRVRLKAAVGGDNPEIDSVISVGRSANWYEREVFDLFGVVFKGHPDLRRIMMPEGWEGHPLRKDYPIHGHRYDYATEE